MVIFYARPWPSKVCVSISFGNILFVPCSYQNQKISFHVTCHFVNKGHGIYSIKRPTSNKRPPPPPPPSPSLVVLSIKDPADAGISSLIKLILTVI